MSTVTLATPADAPTMTISRILNAPPALVWSAWTQPKRIERWWNEGTKVVDLDLRVGGAWRFDMTWPNGQTGVFSGVYLAIEPPRRIVNTFSLGGMYEVTEAHSFDDLGDGRTRYTCVTTFASVDMRDAMVKRGAAANTEAGLERLDALLQTLQVEAEARPASAGSEAG